MLMASSSPEFPAGLIVPVCFLYRANSNAGNEEHFALGNWCRVKHYQYRFQILGNPWQCPAAPFCLPSCSSHAPLLLLTSPPTTCDHSHLQDIHTLSSTTPAVVLVCFIGLLYCPLRKAGSGQHTTISKAKH